MSQSVNANDIYKNPEINWTWTYAFPSYAYSGNNNGLSDSIIASLKLQFTDCWSSLYDVFFWAGILFGDIYGNRGVNTIVFYIWIYFVFKLPNFFNICLGTNI